MSTSQNTKDLQWFLQATKSETLDLHSIVKRNGVVKEIMFSESGIGSVGASLLASALKVNNSLEELQIWEDSIRSKGAEELSKMKEDFATSCYQPASYVPEDFLWRLPKLVLHEIISLLSDEDFDSLAHTSKRMQAYCKSFEIEEKIALLLCLKDKLISFNSQVSLQQFINDQAVNNNVREAQEMARLLIEEEYGMTRILELNGSGLEQALEKLQAELNTLDAADYAL